MLDSSFEFVLDENTEASAPAVTAPPVPPDDEALLDAYSQAIIDVVDGVGRQTDARGFRLRRHRGAGRAGADQ
jgi:hypothetical protein